MVCVFQGLTVRARLGACASVACVCSITRVYALVASCACVYLTRTMPQLEAAMSRLGVRSYGIGVTTMEEVFLKVKTLPLPRTPCCTLPVLTALSFGEEWVGLSPSHDSGV